MDLSQLIPGTTGRQSWSIVSSDTSVQANYGYLINASNNDVTLTLPSNPSLGTFVSYCDFYNKATTNVITISGNGKNIEGDSSDLIIDIDGAAGTLVYTDDTRGWTLSNNNGQNVQTTFDYSNFIDRGDASSNDWEVGDITIDAAWHDLDCSSVVPSNATAIVFRVNVRATVADKTIRMRTNGNLNGVNINMTRVQVANQSIDDIFIVPCDSNQVVEYLVESGTYTNLDITILGWFTDNDETAVGSGNVYAPSDLSDNYLIRGDGGSKKVQTSTVNVSDNGEMTNTSQPCFQADMNTTQSNVTGDDTTYDITGAFWDSNFDQGNNFSNGTFTAPVTGKYILTYYIRTSGYTSSHTKGYCLINTSNRNYTLFRGNYWNMSDGTYLMFNGSIVVDMDEGDIAYITIAVFNGTKVIDINTTTTFSGALIC